MKKLTNWSQWEVVKSNEFFLKLFSGDSFLEKGMCTSFSSGFSTIPEELLRREEEYGHNRREEREPESSIIL